MKFLVTKKPQNRQQEYKYYPKTKDELNTIIRDLLKQGITDLNCIDVSEITDMSYIFWNINVHSSVKVKDIDISEWDVSNVKNMLLMFNGCEEFNSDLSKWNVSNVNFMNLMFYNCKKFNSDLSKWNTSKAIYMSNMFFNCTEFNSDLSNWKVSNVRDMIDMFKGCNKFNSDLSNWDVSKVKYTDEMFNGCTALMENKLIPAWYR